MKKTFSALVLAAVLGATASALTLEEAVLTMSQGSLASTMDISNLGSGDFAVTFTLNSAAIRDLQEMIGKTASPSLTSNYVSVTMNGHTFGTSSGYSSSNGKVQHDGIFISSNAAGAGHNTTSPTYQNSGGMASLTLEDVACIAVTLSYQAGTQSYLGTTVFYNNGTSTTCFGDGGKYHWNGDKGKAWGTLGVNTAYIDDLYMFSQAVTTADAATAINTAAFQRTVPEPATATLGLLALIGLAGCRRRK